MRRCSSRILWGLVGLWCVTGIDAHAAAAGGSPVNAVWVDHDLSFTYMGFTSYYSCEGIEGKVKYVLKQLGARPGFKVSGSGCVNTTGPELMPRVRVRAALPVEATPEVLEKLAKDREKQELAARSAGKPVSSVAEATQQFPATWRTVAFQGTPNSDIQDGDCELLEQLITNVLVPMGVRVVGDTGLKCVPHQVPLDAVDVKLEVLTASQPATPASPDQH